ncbi:MAG: protein kinase, partial [Phycisphaerales bacterium]|nr:protein kinase [Phycisphaerales bacterium]
MTESTSNGVPGTLTPGQTVGKYEIRDLLGAGGQSVVYRAWDSALEREVALKQMTPNLIADPKYADQIRKTIRTIATLGAKNEVVVTIYDLIEEERGMFYAMEYVDGHSLELVLHDNPGPVEVKGVLLILFRLAAALHEIHGAGIIHRDLKPSNIMLAEGLRPKIIDFGVASIGESDVSMPLVTTKYLAPELYEGGACDSRADIYSLGFIIYEMLLGREKFNEIFQDIVRDKHAEALRWMKWHGNAKVSAPPAHEVVPTVPLALSHIVQRMIEKDPEQRFASTEELGRTIKRSFSGKKRGAGAVAPAPAQAQRSAMMARLAAERGLGRLEDEVDYTPAGVVPAGAQAMGPATAPMPKEPMGKKKKIALAVAASLMFVVFAGLVIYKVQQDKQRQISLSQTARGVLTKGCTALETGKYTDSIKLFTTLLENHKGTIEAKHAEYLKPLAEGYVAHSKGDYTRARQLKKDVIIITERLVP